MPSSTSSSDERRPRGPWGRTWLLALGLVVILLGGWEAFWRSRGFRPSVEANDASWVVARARVGRESTVVLGTSRIQAALDPDVWQAIRGRAPVQLALLGTSPAPLLEDLAASGFAGLALVEILPLYAFDASGGPEARSAGVLDRFRRAEVSPSALTEDWLRVYLAGHFVFRKPALHPTRVLEDWRAGRSPLTPPGRMRADRWFPLDFSRLPKAEGEAGGDQQFSGARTGRPAEGAELGTIITRLASAAAAIRERGGEVVFLHLPACGPRRAVEEGRYPRWYWDRLVEATPAPALHADDVPGLHGFPCYDGSHLDVRDAPAFTRALVEAMERAIDAD